MHAWTLDIANRPPRIDLRPPRARRPQRVWQGRLARRLQHLLGLGPGRHPCDKAALRRLWLAAAAAELEDAEEENEPMLDLSDAELARRLREHRIPPTAQRLRVARALFTAPRAHFTAEDVLREVCHRNGGCSRATVYNTLRLFAAQGLIRALVVDTERTYYDTVTRPHAHLYHVDSGELEDLPDTDLRGLLPSDLERRLDVLDISLVVQVRAGRRPKMLK